MAENTPPPGWDQRNQPQGEGSSPMPLTDLPIRQGSKSQVKSTPNSPTKKAAKSPVKSTPKSPVKPTPESPSKLPVQSSTEAEEDADEEPLELNPSSDFSWEFFEWVHTFNMRNPYVSVEELVGMEIELGTLDFSTGVPSQGQQFLVPVPMEKMKKLQERYGFQRSSSRPKEEHFPVKNWAYAHGQSGYWHVCLSLVQLDWDLRRQGKGGRKGPDLIEKAGWEVRNSDEYEQLRCDNGGHNVWMADYIHYRDDASTPHLICSNVDGNMMYEDGLNISEVYSLVRLCAMAHNKDERQVHDIIPITLITSSMRQVRITQGYADGIANKFHINKSSLKNMTDDDAGFSNHLTAMSWLISKPVGQTHP